MKIITLFLLLHLSLLSFLSAEETTNTKIQKTTEQNEPEQLSFIKVSDIAENAVKISLKLKDIQESIKEEETDEIQELIKPYCDSLDVFLQSSNYQDITSQNVRELQKMQSELAIYSKQLKEWKKLLKSRIDIYDINRKFLKEYSALWNQTDLNAHKENAPKAILEHVTSVISSIEELKNNLKIKYDNTLTGSQLVTTKIATLIGIDTNLIKNEKLAKNKIFYQNQASFFELLGKNYFSIFKHINNINNTIIEKYHEIKEYFQTNPEIMLKFYIAIFFTSIFIAYFNYLYRKKILFVREESLHKKTFFFITKGFSTFSILLILIIIALFSEGPKSIVELQLILIILPVIRILQTIIDKSSYKYLYAFLALFVLFIINKNAINQDIESRTFLLLINILLFINIFFILRKKVLYLIKVNFVTKLGNYILALSLLLLFIALISNLIGAVLLSSRIVEGILIVIYASIIFYAIYTILTGYVVIILRRRISTASHMIEKYSKNIEKNVRMLIKIWMFSWWLLIVVRLIGLYPYIISLKDTILSLSWNISQTTISIQSIFDFLFILFITWVIARLTRIILEVEVFARFTLPRGVPTAILTTLNYVITIGGIIIALSSLGVSPQQFALAFGALGVGIGFGLRNIIANFVSGVIMVFERPVQIGDVIEVNKTMGSVQSIGARASTIKTFDGSEVIIPNADFIAKEITNWTLSDEHRRKVVNFKVAFGSDIEEVLKIMKDIALSHPDVLKDPEALATFQGFGEYYLEFKLYFWLSENLIVAHSDVSIGIYKALNNAGIEMPIQKADLKGFDSISLT